MAEAKGIQGKVDQINILFEDNKPIRRFQRFSSEKLPSEQTQFPDPEPEMNLRLSLGGIYGSGNYSKQNPLTRSSSIAGEVVNHKRNFTEQLENTLPKSYLSLARSCSLPAQVESSKRVVNIKELRMMKRVEAKKRAVEKQWNGMKGSEKDKLLVAGAAPTEFPAWLAASTAKSPALNRAIDKIQEGFRKLEGVEGWSAPSSSSNPIKSVPEMPSQVTESENPAKKPKLSRGWIQDKEMKEMPSVTTTGDGPNGRKIQGFLYKYTKGQVCIVCVCHGNFLSPEEFVRHAGTKDVTNPMKHINVCSTSFSY
ncbi:hypothetical protein Goari_007081 [Gossypium aridum]|uniref:Ninja-family protein n=1 Tax=Gossypium aridum TaxID=34290 RepID=A0A7J8XRJ9_GOSAI|nr:hypothetical protein [Gossypium aridum]